MEYIREFEYFSRGSMSSESNSKKLILERTTL
jgi:hypothetical protein